MPRVMSFALQQKDGPSHTSGARPELSPVMFGNATQAMTTLRVGFVHVGGLADGRAHPDVPPCHHPLLQISRTEGPSGSSTDRTGGLVTISSKQGSGRGALSD